MATIEELRREIAREKAYEESDIEMANLGKEKKYLEKDLKARRFKRKYGKFVPSVDMNKVKKVGSGIKSGIQRLGSEVGKVRAKQDARERQEKAIKKRKTKQRPQSQGLGIFG